MWLSISSSSLSWVKFCDAHLKMVLFEVTGEQPGGACMLIHPRQEGHLQIVEALPRSRRVALWFGFFRSGMRTAQRVPGRIAQAEPRDPRCRQCLRRWHVGASDLTTLRR